MNKLHETNAEALIHRKEGATPEIIILATNEGTRNGSEMLSDLNATGSF